MTILTTAAAMDHKPLNLARLLIWAGFVLLLIIAPMLFNKGASLSILSQIGTMMIFALSYNMLLGQGGMLSFGHAVYSGLGAFFAIHAMNLAGGGTIWMPLPLIPLVGGLAGMFFGVLFGYVTTKKSGTPFAMITLGIVELVFSCSLMFPEFFGGEGGISSNRAYGNPFAGITFGPQIQVYYLIAFWLFISTIGMYAFTQTPLGRMINAVRDNPERVEFVGYNTQWIRYLTLVLSGFFAGISGSLSAINFEMVSAENVSAILSGAVLLFTFIGGIGFFFGPMIGAVIGVFLTVMLSQFTPAWQLYLGVFFILIVMYVPGGIASLLVVNVRIARSGKFSRVFPSLAAASAATLVACAGAVAMIEMLYHLTLNGANGPIMARLGYKIDTSSLLSWSIAAGVFMLGALALLQVRKTFLHTWGEVNTEIEEQIRRAQA
jgi:branched-chain amino acid transport system permease protein